MIFELCSTDEIFGEWLFFVEDCGGKLVVRDEYKVITCSVCGKVQEEEAVSFGVSKDVLLKSNKDWIKTLDDRICVSRKFKEVVHDNNIQGLDFIPIPSDNERFLLHCTCLVNTNEELAGFDKRDKCHSCGRYKEVLVGPLLDGLEVPTSDLTFFASEVANENVKVGYRPIFSSESVVKILKKNKISGIDYVEAL